MPDWQKNIYYISGEAVEAVENSPFLERLKKKDLEVIYLVDPIDEYAIQHVTEYDGKKLQSVSKEGLSFGDSDEKTDKKRLEIYKEKFTPLTDYLKEVYDSKVTKVSVSRASRPRRASLSPRSTATAPTWSGSCARRHSPIRPNR